MKFDPILHIPIFLLLVFSFFILNSVAPTIFPSYYWYIVLGLISFFLFSLFDFEVISAFSKYFYIVSILLLVVTLIIGQATRGTVRWIPLGSISIQPSEIIRPFLLVFFANYLGSNKLNLKNIIKVLVLMALPLFLILVQPSLGVTALTAIGFLGLFFASDINKKQMFTLGGIVLLIIPLVYLFLAPYQKNRIESFLDPTKDPLGVGYNAIQSTISVGSGMLLGRGLGKGVGTQLQFLPEHNTDFIFASISEEMGFLGSITVLILIAVVLFRIIKYSENAVNISARIFLSGLFLTFFAQVFVHTGMNMGIMPITGVPFPLVSAGGSSLLATMTALGIVVGTKR